jgi:hypothetical protein
LGRLRPLGEAYELRLLTLAQIPSADLDIPVLGQLASPGLPIGGALKPGPLEVVRLDALLEGGPLRQ